MHPLLAPGRSSPIGATVVDGGVNFSLFSRNGSAVELLLFDREDDPKPARVISLNPETNRTYHYWHTFVPRIGAGQIYGYRVHGALTLRMECASMPRRYFSILTAAVSQFPGITLVKMVIDPETIARQR